MRWVVPRSSSGPGRFNPQPSFRPADTTGSRGRGRYRGGFNPQPKPRPMIGLGESGRMGRAAQKSARRPTQSLSRYGHRPQSGHHIVQLCCTYRTLCLASTPEIRGVLEGYPGDLAGWVAPPGAGYLRSRARLGWAICVRTVRRMHRRQDVVPMPSGVPTRS
jgi:hypothetical protein